MAEIVLLNPQRVPFSPPHVLYHPFHPDVKCFSLVAGQRKDAMRTLTKIKAKATLPLAAVKKSKLLWI